MEFTSIRLTPATYFIWIITFFFFVPIIIMRDSKEIIQKNVPSKPGWKGREGGEGGAGGGRGSGGVGRLPTSKSSSTMGTFWWLWCQCVDHLMPPPTPPTPGGWLKVPSAFAAFRLKWHLTRQDDHLPRFILFHFYAFAPPSSLFLSLFFFQLHSQLLSATVILPFSSDSTLIPPSSDSTPKLAGSWNQHPHRTLKSNEKERQQTNKQTNK